MTRHAIIQSHRPPETIQGTLDHSFAQGAFQNGGGPTSIVLPLLPTPRSGRG